MKRIALAVLVVLSAVSFVSADDAEARKQLTGVWKGRVDNGATGHEITFTADLISGVKDGKRDLGKGAYKIDQSAMPWRMDATEVKEGGAKGQVWKGIYKIDGDSLTWCVGTKDTPSKFETGNGQFMLVLKREPAK
ncbi:MAG: TIGR03067 domain-containing protein [Planctomycetes bacterium]|nr:TIGR03067 domain-containing protein [Planctomycetota bacterium]